MIKIIFSLVLSLFSPSFLVGSEPQVDVMGQAAKGLLADHYVAEQSDADACRSIRGTRELWTNLSLQRPVASDVVDSLAADLRMTDMEGQLRDAGLKVMDPAKRSLALGLRPTLDLVVLYSPKGAGGNPSEFYLVLARVTQDVTPLGGKRISMSTWMKSGKPIPVTLDAQKDVEAIRASARFCVLAFIDVVKGRDE
jgi:hypothetical protein